MIPMGQSAQIACRICRAMHVFSSGLAENAGLPTERAGHEKIPAAAGVFNSGQ